MDVVLNLIFFFIVSKFIDKDSFTFMSPESNQENLRFKSKSASTQNNISSDSTNSFEDSGKFSHVENVVEFSRGGKKGHFDFVPEF